MIQIDLTSEEDRKFLVKMLSKGLNLSLRRENNTYLVKFPIERQYK